MTSSQPGVGKYIYMIQNKAELQNWCSAFLFLQVVCQSKGFLFMFVQLYDLKISYIIFYNTNRSLGLMAQ